MLLIDIITTEAIHMTWAGNQAKILITNFKLIDN